MNKYTFHYMDMLFMPEPENYYISYRLWANGFPLIAPEKLYSTKELFTIKLGFVIHCEKDEFKQVCNFWWTDAATWPNLTYRTIK